MMEYLRKWTFTHELFLTSKDRIIKYLVNVLLPINDKFKENPKNFVLATLFSVYEEELPIFKL